MALVVTKTTLGCENDDVLFWQDKSMDDRIATVEVLRHRMIGGESATRSGLQRVCRIVRR
jgi:hypothetical protein